MTIKALVHLAVYNGTRVDLPMLANKNGEADYNVWFHCMTSSSRNIVILGSGTDIWVYGMIFMEGGWFPNKTMLKEEYKLSMYPLILYVLQHPIIPNYNACTILYLL